MTPSLVIATPTSDGYVTMGYTQSLIGLLKAAAEHGIECRFQELTGNSYIPHARNWLVHQFLKSTATHLLFVDADVDFRPLDALAMLKAADSGHSIVAGIYPKRCYDEARVLAAAREGAHPLRAATELPVLMLTGDQLVDAYGCLVVGSVPMGFTVIRRDVFEALGNAHPELITEQMGEVMLDLFRPIANKSEDVSFCARWRDMGGTIHAYFNAECGHYGGHRFVGGLKDHFAWVT